MTDCETCARILADQQQAQADGTLTVREMARLGRRMARHACPDVATVEAADRAVGQRFGVAGAWSK